MDPHLKGRNSRVPPSVSSIQFDMATTVIIITVHHPFLGRTSIPCLVTSTVGLASMFVVVQFSATKPRLGQFTGQFTDCRSSVVHMEGIPNKTCYKPHIWHIEYMPHLKVPLIHFHQKGINNAKGLLIRFFCRMSLHFERWFMAVGYRNWYDELFFTRKARRRLRPMTLPCHFPDKINSCSLPIRRSPYSPECRPQVGPGFGVCLTWLWAC